MGLRVGDHMPLFSLKDQEGTIFNAKDVIGIKPVVLFFYPRDHTPGCTIEACSFRDSYEEFTDLGAEVIGISADSASSHKGFAEKYRLPYTLLADEGNVVRKKFRVKNRLFNILPGRETYVIDKKGTIAMVFTNIAASGHMREALDAVKKLVEI